MKNSLHKSFSVLLVLLQLIAPLVHAHSEAIDTVCGIHLPGLEYVQSELKMQAIQANSSSNVVEGVIVGIGSGIEYKAIQPLSLIDFDEAIAVKYFDEDPNRYEVGFSPHITAILASQLSNPSGSSRSPPL